MYKFFFPNDNKLKIEMTASWSYDAETNTFHIQRRFYTFRTLFWHCLNTFIVIPAKAIIGNFEIQKEFYSGISFQRGSIALGSSLSGNNSGSATLTISLTVSGSNTVLVGMVGHASTSGAGTFSATWNGSAITKKDDQTTNDALSDTVSYYKIAPASGTHNIVFNTDGSTQLSNGGYVAVLTGADQVTGFDVSTTARSNANKNPTATVTTTRIDSMVFDMVSTLASNTSAAGGQTNILANVQPNATNGYYFIGGYHTTTTAGSITMNYTASAGSNMWGIAVLAIKEVYTPVNYTITIAQGSFTLTGQALNMIWHIGAITMSMGVGLFTLSGQTLLFSKAKIMIIGTGLYTLTGKTLSFIRKWINKVKNVTSWTNKDRS